MGRAITPPRRITRASLARFAYTTDSVSPKASRSLASSPDIEDAIPDLTSPRPTSTRPASRKRKRTTTVVSADGTSTTAADIETETAPAPKARKVRQPARTKPDPETGETITSPPSDWEEIYRLVKAMRQPGCVAGNAAVDTMGCERLALADASPRERRYHTLVALMLSSQTKDTVNAATMERLHNELPPHAPGAPGGLTVDNILAVAPEELNRLIWAVGFHNNKTRYIQQAAAILKEKYGGDIPPTIEGLTSLPGVGPKMAHLCMSAEAGWGRVEGIGVDVHVHRITNLWGWQRPPSKTPEETRKSLEAWLPRDRWKEINWLLVGFGQKVCLPVGRRCGECEVGLRGLCKSAERKKVVEGRRLREVKAEVKGEGDGVVVKTEEVEEKVVGERVVNEEVKTER